MARAVDRREVTFPALSTLRRYRCDQTTQLPPPESGIYAFVSPEDHAMRIGSGQNVQARFKGHSGRSGWFQKMRDGTDRNCSRIGRSEFCRDAHLWGPERFDFYVLESAAELRDPAALLHVERLYMDALRDQTDWGDYNAETPCRCHIHPTPRRYLRPTRTAEAASAAMRAHASSGCVWCTRAAPSEQ